LPAFYFKAFAAAKGIARQLRSFLWNDKIAKKNSAAGAAALQ
jgi:hypothetical protein